MRVGVTAGVGVMVDTVAGDGVGLGVDTRVTIGSGVTVGTAEPIFYSPLFPRLNPGL